MARGGRTSARRARQTQRTTQHAANRTHVRLSAARRDSPARATAPRLSAARNLRAVLFPLELRHQPNSPTPFAAVASMASFGLAADLNGADDRPPAAAAAPLVAGPYTAFPPYLAASRSRSCGSVPEVQCFQPRPSVPRGSSPTRRLRILYCVDGSAGQGPRPPRTGPDTAPPILLGASRLTSQAALSLQVALE